MAEAIYRDQIRIEPVGFKETMASLTKMYPELRVVLRNTVMKALPYAEDEAIELILQRYDISKASLMDQSSRHGRWRFKRTNPTESNLNGKLQISGTRMPVMRFSVSPRDVPNQRGIPVAARTVVTVRVTKGAAQIGKPNVFLAKMKTGHTGVYRRKIPNPGGPRRKRPDGQWTQLPITEEYMLSVPEMLQGKELRAKLNANLDRFVIRTLTEEMQEIPRKAQRRMLKTLQQFMGGF